MPESADNFADDQASASADPREIALLDQLLTPLLEDFHYWFERSYTLLTTEKIDFLPETDQTALLTRLVTAQKELVAAKTLFNLSDHRVGIDAALMRPWHSLLIECQAIALRHRRNQATQG
jgi:hypothetical protein